MTDFKDQPSDTTTDFGFRKVGLNEKQGLVNKVFSSVADRYDLMNDIMSGGLHRVWKDELVSLLKPPKSDEKFELIDVAGGTGDIAIRVLKSAGAGAHVTLCDISPEMIKAGRQKLEKEGLSDRVTLTTGDAQDLPYADQMFDAYTIAFGIRNVPLIEKALSEAFRVLKRGGRFLCLEFSEVQVPLLDTLYDAYSFNAIPALGGLVTGDGEPYRYLVESIRKFPDQNDFSDMIANAGFELVKYRNLHGGIAAVHSGWKL